MNEQEEENEFAGKDDIVSRRLGKTIDQVVEDLNKCEEIISESVIIMASARVNESEVIKETKGKFIPKTPGEEDLKTTMEYIMKCMHTNAWDRIKSTEFIVGDIIKTCQGEDNNDNDK